MPDYGHELRFGVFIPPEAAQPDAVVELAVRAEVAGLDLVTFQDHPYQARFLDAWTLLSVVAARTTTVRLAPNVANLPLRPPVVLARSVASLDRLSNGRIELGLGAGAFWDAIEANGGRRLTPGESVDALAEAIDVIRGVWDTSTRAVRHRGEHYRVVGAHTGPAPAHPVELWVGSYKRRMLRLTGERADGWLPSETYLEAGDLPRMTAAIDSAAEGAGRSPAAIRRLLNVNDAPDQAERLAELWHEHGISTFILAVGSSADVERFAEETAPAVRELVESGVPAAAPARAPRAAEVTATPFATTATGDDGSRLSGERVWDEATRPAGPVRDPERVYTPDQQAAGRHLVDVHDALRAELDQLRDLVGQVARGSADASAVRSFITRMTIRQNQWTLGTFCETYCRVVTHHHTLEDRAVFPHLRRADARLAPVLDRLEEEHHTIADLLERVDGALVELVAAREGGMDRVRETVDVLTDALLSHFAYEERELIEPLARLGFN